MKWPIDGKIAAAFSLALVSVGLLGVLACTSMTNFIKSTHWAARARSVLAEIDDVPLKLGEAEKAQLQYLLSDEESYRTAYQTAATEVDKELNDLRQLTMTSPTQRERVATLTTLTKGRLASLQEAISAKDTDEEDDAIDKILTSRNTVSKQDVQSVLQDIEHEEQQQLAHHDAAATTHARNMRQWTISVSALSVLFVALVGVLLNRDVFRRRRAEAELRESEARYRTLVENANEGIIAITVEGKISAINHGLETMLDWSREELLGKSYGEILTPASAAQSEERLRHALAVERLPSTYEVETVRKDGSIVPVEVRADFLRDAAGHIMGLLALHRDVSIRKVLEQA